MVAGAKARRGGEPQAGTDSPGRGDRGEAAEFIGSSVGEFALLARRHSLDTLAYLLDMVRLEADEVVRQRHGRQS